MLYECMNAKLLQSILTLCDPMDCSLPGLSVHVIFQARILKWIAMPSSRMYTIYMCVYICIYIWTSPDGKESACNAGDLGLIPRSGRSPGEGNGNPHAHVCQCTCTHTHTHFFRFFLILYYYSVWNKVPCAISRTLFIHSVYNSLHLLIPNSWSILLSTHKRNQLLLPIVLIHCKQIQYILVLDPYLMSDLQIASSILLLVFSFFDSIL